MFSMMNASEKLQRIGNHIAILRVTPQAILTCQAKFERLIFALATDFDVKKSDCETCRANPCLATSGLQPGSTTALQLQLDKSCA